MSLTLDSLWGRDAPILLGESICGAALGVMIEYALEGLPVVAVGAIHGEMRTIRVFFSYPHQNTMLTENGDHLNHGEELMAYAEGVSGSAPRYHPPEQEVGKKGWRIERRVLKVPVKQESGQFSEETHYAAIATAAWVK